MAFARKASSLILIAAAGTAVALAGCSKSSDKKSGAKGANKAAASAFKYLPKDSAALFGVSGAITKGMLGSLAKSQIESRMPPEFKAIKEKCGIDVMSDLKTAIMAMGSDRKDKTKQFAVVSGSFDKAKVNACVNKSAVDGKKLSAKEDGKLTAYSQEGESRVFYGWWPSANTVVFSVAENNKAGVEALISQKKSAADNQRLMALVKDVNTGAMVWGVGDIQMVGIRVDPPDGTLLEVDAGKSLKVNMRMRYADKASADKAKGQIDKGLERFKKGMIGAFVGPFLKNLSTSVKNRDAAIDLSLDEAQIKKLMGLAKQFGGMMGGGR